jgi:cell division protein ZapE
VSSADGPAPLGDSGSGDPGGPLAAYRRRRQRGELAADPAQAIAVEKLQSLHNALRRYRPAAERGWLDRLGLAQLGLGRPRTSPPMGLYLYGSVGRGKSMLMDLFFAGAPVEAKRRVHFNAFMLEVHEALHRRRQAGEDGDPIPPLAADLARRAWLLCFDEFQVTNIADAMLLGRLFGALFELGVVVVATSNTAPDDLYAGGLQRELFVPFIALLKEKLDLLQLDGETDHRRARLQGMRVYHTPLGPAADRALAEAFAHLTDGAPGAPDTLVVQGRTLAIPRAARGIACFAFDALCRTPLGAADYLAIAAHYTCVILADVPRLRPEERDVARRFMLLIDALYEHRAQLICSADGAPDELYPSGDAAVEFRRTASRLIEMQSAAYLARPHLA